MVRILVALLIAALVALQFQVWQQYGEVRQLRLAVVAQQEQNQSLHQRNQELAAEVDDLRKGQEAIKERARTELGLIAEGEQFFQVIDPPQDADANSRDSERPPSGNGRP